MTASSPSWSPVFVRFKEERNAGESFGDFCDRARRGEPGEREPSRGERKVNS